MDSPRLVGHLSRAPQALLQCLCLQPTSRPNPRIFRLLANVPVRQLSSGRPYRSASSTESLPRVAQPSLWSSLVPSFLRNRSRHPSTPTRPKAKEWNPATFYIVILLFIGSQAIQMIALRRERVSFNRKADTRIGLLKEVIERVQGGEEVNVEGLLGTGDKAKEKEWEDVLRELEAEDALWQSRSGAKKGRTVVQDATTEPAEARAMESASRGGEDQGRQIQSAAPGRNTDATAPREKRPLREYF